jgi:CBS domain-containing protein
VGELMADRKIGCMSLMDDGRLVGLVTTADILRYVEGLE